MDKQPNGTSFTCDLDGSFNYKTFNLQETTLPELLNAKKYYQSKLDEVDKVIDQIGREERKTN